MYKRAAQGWIKHWDFILLDTICLQIALFLAYYVRFGGPTRYLLRWRADFPGVGMWLILFSVMAAAIFNTMHTVLRRSVIRELRWTASQCLLVFAAIVIFLFSTKDSETVSRIVIYVTMGVYFILGFSTRMLYKRFLISRRWFGRKRKMLLVASDPETAIQALDGFERRPEESIEVCGLVLLNPEGKSTVGDVPVVAPLEGAAGYVCSEWIDEVYITVREETELPVEFMHHCAEMGVTVHRQLNAPSGIQRKQQLERIAKQAVLTSSIQIAKPWQLMVKRFIDILAGLILSIPALLAIVILTPAIKTLSSGPVLLKQERIGQNGRKFRMLSIRSMYMDAGRRLREWRKRYPNEKLTMYNDPRIIGNRTLQDGTQRNGLGLAIRRMSLDNLPQAFNLLTGQMSLVGTRAPSVEEWEKYQYHHRARLACKPGITGLWQASGRSRVMSFEEATAMDTDYIAGWNLWLDFKILISTIGRGNGRKAEGGS